MTLSLSFPLHPLDSCIQKGGGAWARDWRLVLGIQEEKLLEKFTQEDRREQRAEVGCSPLPNPGKGQFQRNLGFRQGWGWEVEFQVSASHTLK